MKLGSQLYLSGGEHSPQDLDKIETLLKQKATLGGLDFLAIWCAGDPKPCEMAIRVCEDLDITPYLWFPVLADIDAFKITDEHSVCLFDGSKGNGQSGKWKGLDGDEDFLFMCPNDDNSVDRNFEYFSKLLDTYNFSGVMLDRIRYPSFANGLEALYTCFCDRCLENAPALLEMKDRVRLKLETPISIEKISSIEDCLFDEELTHLAQFRKNSITRVVSRFASEAKGRGLNVGLDLFAPSLAGCVSQDYEALADHCDWIKPMLYCHAMGPAGLPLELGCFAKGMSELYKQPFDENPLVANILNHELSAISKMRLGDTKIYAGIEAVDDESLGLNITPSIIKDYLNQIRGHADGVIASWNLLQCSDDNLSEICLLDT